jgi:hypothetical protein
VLSFRHDLPPHVPAAVVCRRFVAGPAAARFRGRGCATVNNLPRIALVIGNGAYADVPLKNAPNDAKAIAEHLKRTCRTPGACRPARPTDAGTRARESSASRRRACASRSRAARLRGTRRSDRVAYAAWLEQVELKDEARGVWRALAAERPQDTRLEALARE